MFRGVGLALMAWAMATGGAQARPIDYVVTPVAREGALEAVRITMRFEGDRDGRTEVLLPRTWSGAMDLDRGVVEVRAEGAEVRRDGARLLLRHARGADVTLSYDVVQDFEGDPRVGAGRPYRPTVRPDWFTLVGWTVFAHVEGRDDDPVRFAWGAAPSGWTVASDLDHAGGSEHGFRALADSVLVGGEGMRLIATDVGGAPVRVAVHGDWRFSAEALAERYAGMVEASAAFWGDGGEPFLLALSPLQGPPDARVQSGLGLGDGLAVWLTPNLDLEEANHVIVHEQQHAWLPDRVGGLARGQAEVMDFWFSEGFTDFYALRMELRLGLLSPEGYIEELNRVLRRHASGPTLGVGGADLARAFFSDRQAAGAPYERGLLLALLWDARLHDLSGGRRDLDDAILAMRDARGTAPDRLVRVYQALGGGAVEPDLDAHIGRGDQILLPDDLFRDCAVVEADANGVQIIRPGASLNGPARDACAARLAGL